ncbi:aminodeoxychorismate lyase [Glaciecola sp. 1036]|uniref:aminodeoxychorismate lyase n=1 Tax=Alteromonadaceae TaxID=72275 RepID=UPI003D03BDE8
MSKAQVFILPDNISSQDRSFFYGDGCFTTILSNNHKPLLLQAHLKRLQDACLRLFIPVNNWDEIKSNIESAASQGGASAIIKVVISRGQGGRGYQVPDITQPQVYIYSYATSVREVEVILGFAQTRLAEQPLLAGIKHNNRLEQILAKNELVGTSKGLDDLLMFNYSSHLIEATASNVFYQIDNQWYTPKLDKQGVEGVMRNYVLGCLQAAGISVAESIHYESELIAVQSMFLTNAVNIVQVVSQIVASNSVYSLNVEPCHKIRSLILKTLVE